MASAIRRVGGAGATPHFARDTHECLKRVEADIDILSVLVLDAPDTFLGARPRLIENLHGLAQTADFDDASHALLHAG